ncbi:MAG: hypothetical protein U0800_19210 [Isosphaeraceae bacterium]
MAIARQVIQRPDPGEEGRADYWRSLSEIATGEFKQRARREPKNTEAAIADLMCALEANEKAARLAPRRGALLGQAEYKAGRLFRYAIQHQRYALAEHALARRESLVGENPFLRKDLEDDRRKLDDLLQASATRKSSAPTP